MRLSEHLQQVLPDLGDVALLLDGEGGDGAHAAGGDKLGGVHGRSMLLVLLLGVGWREDSRLRRGKRRGGEENGGKKLPCNDSRWEKGGGGRGLLHGNNS